VDHRPIFTQETAVPLRLSVLFSGDELRSQSVTCFAGVALKVSAQDKDRYVAIRLERYRATFHVAELPGGNAKAKCKTQVSTEASNLCGQSGSPVCFFFIFFHLSPHPRLTLRLA